MKPKRTESAAPLARDVKEFRDDRLFYIGCDDHYAPDQYFGFFRIPRIKVVVVPATDDRSHAKWVLEKLLACDVEEDDELWMLLDTDHCTESQHFRSYELAISEARIHGVKVAISKPSFDVWLALHHIDADELAACRNADEVGNVLRAKLGSYNKIQLREGDFPVETVPSAYDRAKNQDAKVSGGDTPTAVTTRVYQVWHSILSKASTSQLIPALRELTLRIRRNHSPAKPHDKS